MVTVSDIFILPKEAVPAKLTSPLELITPVTSNVPPIVVFPIIEENHQSLIHHVTSEPNEPVDVDEPLIVPTELKQN